MPTFAELKAKAAGAATSGKEKITNVRDRNTSVPMAKTNWDPYSGESAPPPPPPRSLVNNNTKPKPLAPLPPPPSRTSSAALSAASSSRAGSTSPGPPLPSRSSSTSSTPAFAPPLPTRGSSTSTPPPPPPRGRSAVSPAPPARASVVSQNKSPLNPPPLAAGGPPPIVRSTRPGAQSARPTPSIDWTNLTPEDKQVFFSWLDEFFGSFTPPTTTVETDDAGSIPQSHGPPSLRASTKPSTWSHPSVGNQSNDFVLSHPPATTHGSAALDLAYYFAPETHWPTAWYNATDGPSIPPPLLGIKEYSYTCSWRSRGTEKTTNIGVYFSDLSIFWGTIEFSTTAGSASTAKRSACYLPPPEALQRQELVDAHETYGDTIALYAESFLGSGQYCASGECWDLANEALKYFADYDYIPKPVPSISRTHGHLIYEGKSTNGGRIMEGRWRGGDVRIRRGDIIEWRKVRIGSARPGSFFTLGDPDHTAIIVSDCVPKTSPTDGGSVKPSDLGVLVVVEQSLGQPPERKEYDLIHFEEGEMWIYRPVSLKVYLGVKDIIAAAPEGLRGLRQL